MGSYLDKFGLGHYSDTAPSPVAPQPVSGGSYLDKFGLGHYASDTQPVDQPRFSGEYDPGIQAKMDQRMAGIQQSTLFNPMQNDGYASFQDALASALREGPIPFASRAIRAATPEFISPVDAAPAPDPMNATIAGTGEILGGIGSSIGEMVTVAPAGAIGIGTMGGLQTVADNAMTERELAVRPESDGGLNQGGISFSEGVARGTGLVARDENDTGLARGARAAEAGIAAVTGGLGAKLGGVFEGTRKAAVASGIGGRDTIKAIATEIGKNLGVDIPSAAIETMAAVIGQGGSYEDFADSFKATGGLASVASVLGTALGAKSKLDVDAPKLDVDGPEADFGTMPKTQAGVDEPIAEFEAKLQEQLPEFEQPPTRIQETEPQLPEFDDLPTYQPEPEPEPKIDIDNAPDIPSIPELEPDPLGKRRDFEFRPVEPARDEPTLPEFDELPGQDLPQGPNPVDPVTPKPLDEPNPTQQQTLAEPEIQDSEGAAKPKSTKAMFESDRPIESFIPDDPDARFATMNSVTREVRKFWGKAEISKDRKADAETLDQAFREKVPENAVAISQKVLADPTRMLTDYEHFGLGAKLMDLHTKAKKIDDQLAEGGLDEIEAETLIMKRDRMIDDIDVITKATATAGTELGRSFRSRQIGDEFSLQRALETAQRLAKKGNKDLKPEDVKDIRNKGIEIEKLEAVEKDAEIKRKTEEVEHMIGVHEKNKGKKPDFSAEELDKEIASLHDLFKKGCALE